MVTQLSLSSLATRTVKQITIVKAPQCTIHNPQFTIHNPQFITLTYLELLEGLLGEEGAEDADQGRACDHRQRLNLEGGSEGSE